MPFKFLLLALAGWVTRAQQQAIDYLRAENATYRELLGDRTPRLTDGQRLRLAEKAKALGRATLAEVASIARPETIVRWAKRIAGSKYDGSRKRGGKPRTKETVEQALVRFAKQNATWGYTELQNALHGVKHDVSRSTVVRLCKKNGIEPAPERGKKMPWKTFLLAEWDQLYGGDFFTVEVLTLCGFVRYYVFFVMEIATRRVHVAGITRDPSGRWMEQIARNLTDGLSGFLRQGAKLILDRDPLYTKHFRQMLAAAGVDCLRLPPRSPNLNPHVERWVRSIRERCLSRIIILGERGLRRAVLEFVDHYHGERVHQGLGKVIEPDPTWRVGEGSVACRMRLGGLLKYYYRRAA